ncbi:hypothetical protein THASP1DRAFT_21855 [Thamnocephalis sphaerospora]|uniref:Uncharacterized protein n=1 Tax=Thamnocephalis sphaerospora TaxID=78915 RepID=A0A4P9XWT7_9FUNG|nr:hypothetical protein THASP1DRAFT_21855 [Thamnocephalis sphaerospora]|eukprot:RKP10452.1 hypothetical protein THASP1DRAFT_21855 [Thamnocephalis sphaerospora]
MQLLITPARRVATLLAIALFAAAMVDAQAPVGSPASPLPTSAVSSTDAASPTGVPPPGHNSGNVANAFAGVFGIDLFVFCLFFIFGVSVLDVDIDVFQRVAHHHLRNTADASPCAYRERWHRAWHKAPALEPAYHAVVLCYKLPAPKGLRYAHHCNYVALFAGCRPAAGSWSTVAYLRAGRRGRAFEKAVKDKLKAHAYYRAIQVDFAIKKHNANELLTQGHQHLIVY